MAEAILKYEYGTKKPKYNYAWTQGTLNYGDAGGVPNYVAANPNGYQNSIGWIDIVPDGSNIYLNSISLHAARTQNSIVYSNNNPISIASSAIPQAILKVNSIESNTISITKSIEVDTAGGGTTSFGNDVSKFQSCKFIWSGRGCRLSADWNNIYLKYNTNGNIFIAPNNSSGDGIKRFVYAIEFTIGSNIHIKIDADTWKAGMCYVKVGGAWKLAENVYVKINNQWKQGI